MNLTQKLAVTAAVIPAVLSGATLSAVCGYLAARHSMRAQLLAAQHAAFHDPLTGLLNRAGLHDVADALISGPAPVLVAIVDLVGFKKVNDTHGHEAGDHILTTLGARLTMAGLAARLGGDEFVLIVPAATALPNLHAALTAPVIYQGRTLTFGATIGGYLGRPDQLFKVWLRQADLAMYAARAERRTTCLYANPYPMRDVEPRPAVRTRDQARPTSHLATASERRTA